MNTEEKVNRAISNNQLKDLSMWKVEYAVPFDHFLGPIACADCTQIMPYVYKKIAREKMLNKNLKNAFGRYLMVIRSKFM